MALSPQLSLTVELTRLVSLESVTKTFSSALSLARDLQGSGSDLVVEEDVSRLFQRCRIDTTLESSFRTIISGSGIGPQIFENILLRFGAGPSVVRAFHERRYIPMVVICSMLSSVYDVSDLASLVYQVFEIQAVEKQAEFPSASEFGTIPSEHIIKGVLQACQDQTSSYDWGRILLTITRMLGLENRRAGEAIPPAIFRGVIDMFPFPQHLPEDRLVHIQCRSGVCLLITWAHKVMGLKVLVRTHQGNNHSEMTFGNGSPQVIIDDFGECPKLFHLPPSITLLQTSDREKLFEIRPDLDERQMQGDLKRPLKGYGKFLLRWNIRDDKDHSNLLRLFETLATSMAIMISKALYEESRANTQHNFDSDTDALSAMSISDGQIEDQQSSSEEEVDDDDHDDLDDQKGEDSGPVIHIDENRIIAAAECIFDRKITGSSIQSYISRYATSPYNRRMQPRDEIRCQLEVDFDKNEKKAKEFFQSFIPTLRYLSIVVLAAAHIKDLHCATKLPLSCSLERLSSHSLADELLGWRCKDLTGSLRSGLQLSEDAWFHVFALLMVGRNAHFDVNNTALVSDSGWSVYLSTFADPDPSYAEQSIVVVQRGVPCRGTVYKHYISDGPKQVDQQPLRILYRGGEIIKFDTTVAASTVKRPMIGEGPDTFLVTLAIRSSEDQLSPGRYTGYRELCAATWGADHTESCDHSKMRQKSWKLPSGCVAVSGGSVEGIHVDETVVVFLTAGNAAARWRALLSLAFSRDRRRDDGFQKPTMIRKEDCCYKCAVDQCRQLQKQCFLIL